MVGDPADRAGGQARGVARTMPAKVAAKAVAELATTTDRVAEDGGRVPEPQNPRTPEPQKTDVRDGILVSSRN